MPALWRVQCFPTCKWRVTHWRVFLDSNFAPHTAHAHLVCFHVRRTLLPVAAACATPLLVFSAASTPSTRCLKDAPVPAWNSIPTPGAPLSNTVRRRVPLSTLPAMRVDRARIRMLSTRHALRCPACRRWRTSPDLRLRLSTRSLLLRLQPCLQRLRAWVRRCRTDRRARPVAASGQSQRPAQGFHAMLALLFINAVHDQRRRLL